MSERTGRKRLDDLRCIGSVVGADAASEGWRGVEKEGQIRAFSCKKRALASDMTRDGSDAPTLASAKTTKAWVSSSHFIR